MPAPVREGRACGAGRGCGPAFCRLTSSPHGSRGRWAERWGSLGRLAPPAVPGLDPQEIWRREVCCASGIRETSPPCRPSCPGRA